MSLTFQILLDLERETFCGVLWRTCMKNYLSICLQFSNPIVTFTYGKYFTGNALGLMVLAIFDKSILMPFNFPGLDRNVLPRAGLLQ